MTTQRTGGMTAIGILNIVFGSFGCLFGLLALLGTGLLTAFGAAASGTEPGAGAAVATVGAIGMLVSLGLLGASACLLFGGVGVLKVAPFGRKYTLIGAGACLGLTALNVFMSGFSIDFMSVIMLGYCGFVMYMCMTPQWKQAFSSQGTMTSQSNSYSRDYRAAA